MFVDEAFITVFAGDGGNGCCSFRREKFVPRGGPDGGDGGQGGSVVLQADRSVATLLTFRYRTLFRAQRGRHGLGANKTGRSGDDLILKVPVGTVVAEAESGHLLADLDRPGQRLVVARGGRGGRGNARFASSTNRAPTRRDPGEAGEERALRLELKLLADVGLIGFPNAGKSTLISRISAARPKIAGYPFTTLEPHLGVVDRGGYRSFVVADLPGLIEGAHQGAGLGHRFLRHVERCRLLLHLVDPADPDRDPLDGIEALNGELAGYSPELAAKPQIMVATKADTIQDSRPVDRLQAWAGERDLTFLVISSQSGEGLERLVGTVGSRLDSLDKEVETCHAPAGVPEPESVAPAVGVLGGTFDPIHDGHLEMARAAKRSLGLDRVLLLPAAIPPHKGLPGITNADHRLAMLNLAVNDEDGVAVETMELDTGAVCYTIDSLRRLQKEMPGTRLVFVLGMDSLLEIETWRDYEVLLREFDLAVIDRDGNGMDEARRRLPARLLTSVVPIPPEPATQEPPPELGRGGTVFHIPMGEVPVSSTEIRERAALGEKLHGLVPPAVARYIRANGLYRQEDRR
jgi:GTP-binding protein